MMDNLIDILNGSNVLYSWAKEPPSNLLKLCEEGAPEWKFYIAEMERFGIKFERAGTPASPKTEDQWWVDVKPIAGIKKDTYEKMKSVAVKNMEVCTGSKWWESLVQASCKLYIEFRIEFDNSLPKKFPEAVE